MTRRLRSAWLAAVLLGALTVPARAAAKPPDLPTNETETVAPLGDQEEQDETPMTSPGGCLTQPAEEDVLQEQGQGEKWFEDMRTPPVRTWWEWVYGWLASPSAPAAAERSFDCSRPASCSGCGLGGTSPSGTPKPTEPDGAGSFRAMQIMVQEAPTGCLLFGLGVNSDTGVTGSIVLYAKPATVIQTSPVCPFAWLKPSVRQRLASSLLFGVHPLLALASLDKLLDFPSDHPQPAHIEPMFEGMPVYGKRAEPGDGLFGSLSGPLCAECKGEVLCWCESRFLNWLLSRLTSDPTPSGSSWWGGAGRCCCEAPCWLRGLIFSMNPPESARVTDGMCPAPAAPAQDAGPTCPYLKEQAAQRHAPMPANPDLGRDVLENLKRLQKANRLVKQGEDLAHEGHLCEALACFAKALHLCPGRYDERLARDLRDVEWLLHASQCGGPEPAAMLKARTEAITLLESFWTALQMLGCPVSMVNVYSSDPNQRILELIDNSENLRQIEYEWQRIWLTDHPSAQKPERTSGGITCPEQDIESQLKKLINLSLTDVALRTVLENLRACTGLNIHVDEPALEEAGIDLDHPVSLKVEQVTLQSVLKLLLDEMHLTYAVKDGVLEITPETPAKPKCCAEGCCPGCPGCPECEKALARPADEPGVAEQAAGLMKACHLALSAGRREEAAALAREAFALDPEQVQGDPVVYKLHLLADHPTEAPCHSHRTTENGCMSQCPYCSGKQPAASGCKAGNHDAVQSKAETATEDQEPRAVPHEPCSPPPGCSIEAEPEADHAGCGEGSCAAETAAANSTSLEDVLEYLLPRGSQFELGWTWDGIRLSCDVPLGGSRYHLRFTQDGCGLSVMPDAATEKPAHHPE